MYTVKRITIFLSCIVVLLSSFVFSSSAAIEFSEPDFYIEDFNAVMTPNTPSILATNPVYSYVASNSFVFDNKFYTSDSFLFHEDLPYGKDTAVISFLKPGSAVYLFFVDSRKLADVYLGHNESNGYCKISIVSESKIYRIGYGVEKANPISCGGVTGLTDYGVTHNTFSSGYENWTYNYPLIAGNFDVCVSSNNSNLAVCNLVDGEAFDGTYGIAPYPSRDILNTINQQESNSTLKSLLAKIKSLPSDIASSIQGFFTSLKNYLLYFQEEEPDRVYPFSNLLRSFTLFFSDHLNNFERFNTQLSNSYSDIVDYIISGREISQRFLGALPLIEAFLFFFIAFCVVRKVVGR